MSSTMNAGRKRSFDTDQALDAAMRVFWENGYAGTSMTQLTEALGINKPSLYAAFGNKERLFASALQRYQEKFSSPNFEYLADLSDQPFTDRLEAFLFGIIDTIAAPGSPGGCLLVKGSCESGGSAVPPSAAASLEHLCTANEQALVALLEHEQEHGNLPRDVSPGELAAYLQSVMYGLSVLAKQGKGPAELRKVALVAIRQLGRGNSPPHD